MNGCIWQWYLFHHYGDVIMSATASQITSLAIVCSNVYSGTDQRKHQSSASLAFVPGIYQWPVNSPHKGPVTRKMFPFDDVIMYSDCLTCIGFFISCNALQAHMTDENAYHIPVAPFTKVVNSRLTKRPLVSNGRLTKCGLTSLVKEAEMSQKGCN